MLCLEADSHASFILLNILSAKSKCPPCEEFQSSHISENEMRKRKHYFLLIDTDL